MITGDDQHIPDLEALLKVAEPTIELLQGGNRGREIGADHWEVGID